MHEVCRSPSVFRAFGDACDKGHQCTYITVAECVLFLVVGKVVLLFYFHIEILNLP